MHLESNNNNIITIVSFFDDNYGDMLIKNSFECILKTVLDNLGQKGADFRRMPLREVDEELIKSSSLVCFSGGGLFGLSYLTFYPYVEKILEIAEDSNVPVVFSSMGINNMDYREGDDDKFIKMLGHKCIKAISVREQIDWFRKYNKREDLSVAEVCDPAMWSRYMIKPLNEPKQQNDKKLVGINVVRGVYSQTMDALGIGANSLNMLMHSYQLQIKMDTTTSYIQMVALETTRH